MILLAASLALAPSLAAQQPAAAVPADALAGEALPGAAALPEGDLYRREVFRYQAGGRPDPFRPLLTGDDMGVRVQDLRLVGIIHSSTPGASVAVFTLPSDSTRVRMRTGQRLGAVTVVAIHPRRVDVREDALGVSRTYALELQRNRRPVATEGGAAAPPPPVDPAPAPPAAPRP